jgi:hypothetical protein
MNPQFSFFSLFFFCKKVKPTSNDQFSSQRSIPAASRRQGDGMLRHVSGMLATCQLFAARPLSRAASPRGLVRAYTKQPTAGGRRFRFSLQRSLERAKISSFRRLLNVACNLLGCFPACGV